MEAGYDFVYLSFFAPLPLMHSRNLISQLSWIFLPGISY